VAHTINSAGDSCEFGERRYDQMDPRVVK